MKLYILMGGSGYYSMRSEFPLGVFGSIDEAEAALAVPEIEKRIDDAEILETSLGSINEPVRIKAWDRERTFDSKSLGPRTDLKPVPVR